MNNKIKEYKNEKSQIVVITNRCKGCYICVDFCPKDCLEIVSEKVRVKDLDSCITCGICEIRCPDFAIQVTKIKEPKNGK